MNKKVLILDGDSIAYRCAAAGEQRSIEVTHKPTGIKKSFKHRTEFKKSMEERGKEITDDFVVEDKQEPEPIAYVLNTIKNHIDRIEREVQPSETIIFAGEQFNFRTELPLPKKYKGQRSALRPVHLKEAKSYLHNKYKAVEACGYEVDDACCIAAYDALRSGNQAVMFFYEKDQYQLDGVTLLYDEDMGFRYETVPKLGELRLEKSSVKGLGLKFLAYQWICSDPVDNYCAYDLSSVKFGPKSAYNVLNDCKNEQEVLSAVSNQFKKFYPEPFEYTDWTGKTQQGDWLKMMQLYYFCAKMMRSSNDKLDCLELFEQYGVTP